MARREQAKSGRRPPHPWGARIRQMAPSAIMLVAVIVGLGALLGIWLVAFVHHSPYFWVSAVEVRMEPGQQWVADPRIGYRLPRPIHILTVNLRALADAISREHPQLARVIVRRELPGRLVAHVTLREAVAQLRGRQYYLVSADRMILAPGSSSAWGGLPVVLLGSRAHVYQPGQVCAAPELRQALAVLREVQRSKCLGARRVSAVRVAPTSTASPDARMVTLVLDSGLELRALPGDLAPQLTRLGDLMRGRGRELDQAQYVDLRFDDLVIGLRGDEE